MPACEGLPPDFKPWWQQQVDGRLRDSPGAQPIDLEALIVSALAYSPHVRAVSQEVLIQETKILEAEADFDVRTFMDTKFFRKSEPIGNELETGGPPRLREGDFGYAMGLRKRTPLGGSWEVSQRIGMRDSNSRFFSPEQQGNSRFSISFNQPLFSGFGQAYNTALILLADIETTAAMDQTLAALQDHLIQIARAYWELYLQRVVLLQNRRHLQRAEVILERLEKRREVDSLKSQIVRAESAVSTRRAKLIRAATRIRNTEARLRSLINSPQLQSNPAAELIPRDDPGTAEVDVSLRDAMATGATASPRNRCRRARNPGCPGAAGHVA